MEKLIKLEKEEFITAINQLGINDDFAYDFLYEIFEGVIETVISVIKASPNYKFSAINQYYIILYIVNEYKFHTNNLSKVEIISSLEQDEFYNFIASLCADKYLTNEQLSFKDEAFLNRFNPPISTLDLYLNFSLRTLSNLEITNQSQGLIRDLLTKAFKIGKCITTLLVSGFETEAFSTWRTLHENECLIIALIKGGDKAINSYFKHIRYSLAFRGQIKSKEETDEVFIQIKDEMHQHDLKSKDMKKFIEYGYLYDVDGYDKLENFKLNFRDGVENVAALRNYSPLYEMASEIAHSSPLLIYSNRSYFYELTIINLLESFFRLESIFEIFYKNSTNSVNYNNFKTLESLYLNQLKMIHQIYMDSFENNKNDVS